MKKIILIAIFALVIMPLALARQIEYSQDNNLKLDLVSYSPSPALIGSTSILKFEVTNIGSNIIANQEIIASTKFPLSVTGSNTITIDSLKPDETKQLEFEVKVSSSAPEGTHVFVLQFEDPTVDSQFTAANFDISVKRLQRTIASTRVTTDPEYIPPGSKALINVEIENNAGFAMKDVEVKLNFSDAIPLAPYETTSQKQIDIIKSNSSEKVTFQVIALPNAEPNVYRLPLSLTFNDELGNENTRQDFIGIIISSKPEYDLTIENSALIRGIKDKVTVSVSNIGPSNIKYLILEVLPSKYYQILNPPRVYIGNLEPDDYETSDFDFYPKTSGSIAIKVKLEYKDDMNNPITDTKDIQVHVYSKTYAKMIGLLPGTISTNFIIFVLFIIFIYLTYKAWRITKNITLSMKQAGFKMLIFAVNVVRHLRWAYIKRIPRKIKIFFIKLQ